MTGRLARAGFHFSDLVVIVRVLNHLAAHRVARIEGTPPPAPPRFKVEASAHPDSEPEWDVLEERPSAEPTTVLEEIKSGQVGDRSVLWRRIRRTVADLDRFTRSRLVPRLTVNCETPPENPERWRQLAACAQTASANSLPPKVRSAANLAEEALYWLTHEPERGDDRAREQPGSVLTEERAREVLSAFEYNDGLGKRAVRLRAEELIGFLSPGETDVLDALMGEVSRRAQSPDTEEHSFLPQDLWACVEILQRLSEVPLDAVHLWQKLTKLGESASSALQPPPESTIALPYQDWRRVQPELTRVLEVDKPSRVALTGRGGMGKSVLLDQLAQEARAKNQSLVLHLHGIDLRAENPRVLGDALELGGFLASARDHSFHVLIDAFEDVADTPEQRRDYLAKIGGIAEQGTTHVVLTIRTTAWKDLAASQSGVSGWRQAELADWAAQAVENLVGASQRPQLPADVLQLLGTPLFLDLFLRTFGAEEPAPTTLHTPHAILSAYWERRILRREHSDASVRRSELLRCAQEEATGRREHADPNQVLVHLAGEGVFLGQGGTFRFRHPLLRDFALAQWALSPESGSATPTLALAQIQNGLTRWGAMRALFEAACAIPVQAPLWEMSHSAPSPVGFVRDAEREDPTVLLSLAEVLGELPQPPPLDVSGALGAFASAESASRFIERLLDLARLSLNQSWLAWIAQLPDSSRWFDQTPWAGTGLLDRAARLLEAVWHNTPLERHAEARHVTQAAAQRIREWSRSRKFQDHMGESDGRGLMHLMPLVAQHAPGERTLEWLTSHAMISWQSRWGVLEALPHLVSAAQALSCSLSTDAVVNLFVAAGGLQWEDGVLVPCPRIPAMPNEEHLRTTVLLGHGGRHRPKGLLYMLPESFLPVALGFLPRRAKEQDDLLRATLQDAADAAPSLSSDNGPAQPPSTELELLEHALDQRSQPRFSMEDVLGRLIDDTHGGYPLAAGHERALVINTLESRLREAVDAGDTLLLSHFWSAARGSRSATSWLLLLESLTSGELSGPELVDEVLIRRPLYHLSAAQPALHRALSLRWRSASPGTREQILQRISEVARTPRLNGLYVVAPILCALPEEDHPIELRGYIKLFQLQGIDPQPRKPQSAHPVWGTVQDTNSGKPLTPWQEVISQVVSPFESDQPMLVRTLEPLRRAMANGFPNAGELKVDYEPLVAVHRVLRTLADRRDVSAAARNGEPAGASVQFGSTDLDREEIISIARWALSIMRSTDYELLDASKQPVPVDNPPIAQDLEPWKSALWLLDEALAHPSMLEDSDLHQEFLDEVRRATEHSSPSVAWYLFTLVRPYHWFRSAGSGDRLLWQLLSQKITDPGALDAATHHLLLGLPSEHVEHLVRRWLGENASPSASEENAKFVVNLGGLIGAQSLRRKNGERVFWADLAEELLIAPPHSGALSERSTYLSCVSQLVFSAKQAFRFQAPPPSLIADYADLIAVCWKQLRSAPPGQSIDTLWQWAFDPINELADVRDTKRLDDLWNRMRPVACSIMSERPWSEVYWLLSTLPGEALAMQLGAEALMDLIEALHYRPRLSLDSSQVPVGHSSANHDRQNALERAAELAEYLGSLTSTSPDMKHRLFNILQDWALDVHRAIVATRHLRALP